MDSPKTSSNSSFQAAIQEYLQTLPKKSNKRSILATCIESGNPSPQDVEEAISRIERSASEKPATRRIRKCLNPVINVLNDYSGILDSLAQADPMPSAVVWGSLKAVIQCSNRYLGLYDTIRTQLNALTNQLARLSWYEELFGHSLAMQDCLKQSYVNLLRFWSRVEKECRHCAISAMLRSVASFSTAKLDKILEQLRQDADDIDKLVPVVRERLEKGERDDAAEERRLAGISRAEISTFIQEQRVDKFQRDLDRKRTRQKEVREWLRGCNESNIRQQARNVGSRQAGTSEWLLKDSRFLDWADKSSPKPTVWLYGAPGMGKSVTCASAVEQLKGMDPSCAVAFHYYRFDEECTALTTYRNLAEQLFDQLWHQVDDVPDNVHAQIQSSNQDPDKIKQFIELLATMFSVTYILLDGLDEECDRKLKWTEALDVLIFFEGLTAKVPCSVRLWCSSQDRLCVRNKLKHFPTINMDQHLTGQDIEMYLSQALSVLDIGEVDPGTEAMVLEDLKGKANGNFLWAHLMVQSLEQAANFDDVVRRIQEGLPLDLNRYYERIFQRVNIEQRTLTCKVFSTVVFAKRPLSLEELSEAIGMTFTNDMEDLNRTKEPFRRKLKEICAPLIEIYDDQTEAQPLNSVCTLTHSTVQSFLLKNPNVLQIDQPSYPISLLVVNEAEIANACLRYLTQPRYQDLLVQQHDTYVTSSGEDVTRHHLLSYAAKYWDKHLDNIECNQEWLEKVESFLRSSQFVTCLQVQSRFVEGQFSLWYARGQAGPGFRRTFPRWFCACGQQGEKFHMDYTHFVAEWNHLLDTDKDVSGEIDRCLWTALGPQNFLSRNYGRYTSFTYSDTEQSPDSRYYRYYDQSNEDCLSSAVVRIRPSEENSQSLLLEYLLWNMNGLQPKLVKRSSSTISEVTSQWALYDRPHVVSKTAARPAPLSIDHKFRFLRAGSQILVDSGGDFTAVDGINEANRYFEEFACRGNYVATATRRNITSKDIYSTGLEDNTVDHLGENFDRILQEVVSPEATSESRDRSGSDDESRISGNSSKTSLDLESAASDMDLESTRRDSDASLELSDSEESLESNSAYESWSESSTDPRSDETEDGEQWNDFADSDSDLDVENDVDPGSDSEDDIPKVEYFDSERPEDDDAKSDSMESRPVSESDLVSDSDASNDSISGYYSDDETGSDSDSESDAPAQKLETLLGGQLPLSLRKTPHERGALHVYETNGASAKQVFHFSIDLAHSLFNSPPVFHPSAPLIVWPLHQGHILFADFSRKTYFTRSLSGSSLKMCFVFIRAHFSLNGQYLHIAALEARPPPEDEAGEEEGNAPLKRSGLLSLTLQVSTHRLSAHKTSRAPPRLLKRSIVPLSNVSTISTSRLPYSLTWSDQHLYFTTSDRKLNLIRVPLFRSKNIAKGDDATQTPVKDIYLPESAIAREVSYYPPRPHLGHDRATVILGSRSSAPARGVFLSKNQVSPPAGFFLHEDRDLGGWKTYRAGEGEEVVDNGKGGRLQGKYEKFDRVQDCDIVPYLEY